MVQQRLRWGQKNATAKRNRDNAMENQRSRGAIEIACVTHSRARFIFAKTMCTKIRSDVHESNVTSTKRFVGTHAPN